MTVPLRSIAYGGGVQSTGLLVLSARRAINFPLALFANTGDDSEDEYTTAFVKHIAAPYAEHHGIELVTVQKTIGKVPDTIRGKIDRTKRSEVIPVRTSAGGKPMSRSCTVDFKIETMGRELKARGAGPDNLATVAIGISLDEAGRASRKPRDWERIEYPLIGVPSKRDLPIGWARALRRVDCETVIRSEPLPAQIARTLNADVDPAWFGPEVWGQLVESGFAMLPVPVKSSCWFCPFHTIEHWNHQRITRPALFEKACGVERQISTKAGKPRYLTRFGVPLEVAVPAGVKMLPIEEIDDDDTCVSGGMCAT